MGGVVVIGGGQAAVAVIARLRAMDPARRITLVGSEPEPPYQRPPLSKAYLLGDATREHLLLRPADWYAQHDVALRLGTRAARIDPLARRVELSDGGTLPFDDLVLCTGAEPRRLPDAIGGGLQGVHTVRGISDVEAIRSCFQPGGRVLIVGGGYIGLEAAAVAVKSELQVTILETAPRILQRVAAEATSDYFRALHRSNGVDLREGTGLLRLEGAGRVQRAVLSTRDRLEMDFVLVAIGVRPADDLAAATGLALDNGIAVDAFCRTSAPHIFAAGDCASFPYEGRRIRLESVQNAVDQGEALARVLCGGAVPYDPKPWFWSDQYDVKLQIAGLSTGYTRTVTRPGKRAGCQSVWYFRDSALLAVDAMNDPASYMTGRKLIEAGRHPAASAVADPDLPLNALLRCSAPTLAV